MRSRWEKFEKSFHHFPSEAKNLKNVFLCSERKNPVSVSQEPDCKYVVLPVSPICQAFQTTLTSVD